MKHYILAAAALAFCAACEQHPAPVETSSNSNSTEPAIEKTPALEDKKVEPFISTPTPAVETPAPIVPAPVEEKKPETAEPAPAPDEKKPDAPDSPSPAPAAPAADPKP